MGEANDDDRREVRLLLRLLAAGLVPLLAGAGLFAAGVSVGLSGRARPAAGPAPAEVPADASPPRIEVGPPVATPSPARPVEPELPAVAEDIVRFTFDERGETEIDVTGACQLQPGPGLDGLRRAIAELPAARAFNLLFRPSGQAIVQATCFEGDRLATPAVKEAALDWLSRLSRADPADHAAGPTPRLEVVFVVDTTASMTPFLRAARARAWELTNQLASLSPRPRLALGLVAYRDEGDEYVARSWPLTEDLDAFYAALSGLQARGGGDRPELVETGLAYAAGAGHDGISPAAPPPGCDASFGDAIWTVEIPAPGWSPLATPRTERVVVLVGDAPAHSREAALSRVRDLTSRGVVVHTLLTGSDADAAADFAAIAQAGGGVPLVLDVGRRRGGPAVTPFDADLVAAQRRIEATVLPFGGHEAEAAAWDARSDALAPGVAASRASTLCKTGELYRGDLVLAVERGLRLEDLPRSALPDGTWGLECLRERIAALEVARAAARADVARLVAARDAWLAGRRGDAPEVDRALLHALRPRLIAAGFAPPGS